MPGAAGIDSCAWKILRGASLASTAIVMVGAVGFEAATADGIAAIQTATADNQKQRNVDDIYRLPVHTECAAIVDELTTITAGHNMSMLWIETRPRIERIYGARLL